ncbi:MAG TPA: UrcA family protein [Steroidobacteraceae bacterium]|jgi:UrcA family protein|nr:UrcA family protein [Steroidobacteraceae bacterium]
MFGKKTLKSNAGMLLVLAATVIASAPICSHADESTQAAEHVVKYSKSDLSTTEGAHHIYSRIEAAANDACGTSRTDIDFIMRGNSPCVRRAIARAVNATKSSNLSQVYIDKNGVYVAHEFGVRTDVLTTKN